MPALSRLLVTLTIGLALGCTSGSGPVSSPASSLGGVEADIVYRLNQARSRAGLDPLRLDAAVTAIAREHSEAMASGKRAFGHDGFSDRTRSIRARAPAENVFYTQRTSGIAEQAVQTWYDSPPHRKNMLGDHGAIGIGAARGATGKLFVTAVFAR